MGILSGLSFDMGRFQLTLLTNGLGFSWWVTRVFLFLVSGHRILESPLPQNRHRLLELEVVYSVALPYLSTMSVTETITLLMQWWEVIRHDKPSLMMLTHSYRSILIILLDALPYRNQQDADATARPPQPFSTLLPQISHTVLVGRAEDELSITFWHLLQVQELEMSCIRILAS